MKKIGFMVQVATLIIALPLLSILEINHVKEKTPAKKTGSYVITPAKKSTDSFDAGELQNAVLGRYHH